MWFSFLHFSAHWHVLQRVKLWKSKKANEQTCEVSEKVKVKMLLLLALLSPVLACTGPGLACQPLPGLQTLDIADPDYLVQTPEGQVNNCCKTRVLKSSCPVMLNRSKAKAWFLQLARLLGLGREFHMLNNPGDGAHRNPSKTSPFDSRGKIGSFLDWKKTVLEPWPGRSGRGFWTAPNWARSACSTNLTQTWPWPLSARWSVNEPYVEMILTLFFGGDLQAFFASLIRIFYILRASYIGLIKSSQNSNCSRMAKANIEFMQEDLTLNWHQLNKLDNLILILIFLSIRILVSYRRIVSHWTSTNQPGQMDLSLSLFGWKCHL